MSHNGHSKGPSKGRGTHLNVPNRFHAARIEAVEENDWENDAPLPRLTEVRHERAKTVISRNRSPDIPFEQSLNAYRGCEHGCIYCFARPSHAYWDLSPGIDFETRLIAKTNVAEQLEAEINHPSYICKPLALGSNTDPYQPIERELKLTRQVLGVMLNYRHPVTIVTKGALILRDLDILRDLADQRLVHVSVSLTTLDIHTKRVMEPRTASPAARLRVIKTLRKAGVPVNVLVAPIIPMINDHEIEGILSEAAAVGAQGAYYALLRLPLELGELFENWLNEHFPLRAEHVMSLIRQSRGGRIYDSDFSQRMSGRGAMAELIAQRFKLAKKRHGLDQAKRGTLDCTAFTPKGEQFSLFG
ncbi:hypothetical protein LMG33818_001070 [Halomonadaceae bacterium LMG 33818]|uniref:PA0069 family radical SAM protein n=1 Tax=Cernens ardua TaxID=3402176 RepID=UPI003EDC620D